MSTDISINQEQPNFLVYKHTNKINGKVYIGITCRKPEHRWKNGKGYSYNEHFYKSIQKYGWDNFDHEIIQENLSELDAKLLEENLISKYDSINPEKGYNSLNSSVKDNIRLSEETKQKISKGTKGKPSWCKGIKLSTEQTKKRKGRTPWNKGKTGIYSEEYLKKLSDSHKGKHLTEEQKIKIGLASKGKKHSEETKKKISLDSIGKSKSKESCHKMSMSKLGRSWYNNGILEILTKDPPEGYIKGRLPK